MSYLNTICSSFYMHAQLHSNWNKTIQVHVRAVDQYLETSAIRRKLRTILQKAHISLQTQYNCGIGPDKPSAWCHAFRRKLFHMSRTWKMFCSHKKWKRMWCVSSCISHLRPLDQISASFLCSEAHTTDVPRPWWISFLRWAGLFHCRVHVRWQRPCWGCRKRCKPAIVWYLPLSNTIGASGRERRHRF